MESPRQEIGQSPNLSISRSNLDQSPVQERGCIGIERHVRDHGITILSEGIQPVVDIFLIHGLQGHPQRTFTYIGPQEKDSTPPQKSSRLRKIFSRSSKKESNLPVSPQSPVATTITPNVFWPLDLLPHDFPQARVATFGYDSKVTNWFKGPAMQLDIFSYGESLLNSLDARRRADPERPLIFIVHSLGGLILKDVLRRARTAVDTRFKSIYTSVKAIFFFGTPHRGGSYVNLGLTVRKLAACAGFDTNDVLLRDLKFDSSVAKLLREEFAKMLDEQKPKVFTFQEATGISGFGPLSGKVVEDSSSALDYAYEQKDFITGNHIEMCRFSGFEDDGYQKTKDCLILCLDSIQYDLTHQSSPGLRERLLASLHMPETQERFNQVDEAYESTCNWIFERENLGFVKWLQTGNGVFWINGKPGSGKSTLMKFVISNHRTFQYLYMNRPKHRLIWAEFFFSNRGKKVQKTLEGLYHRILYQLLKQADYLTRFVQPIFENSAEAQGVWSLIYLEAAMLAIVKQREEKINICLFIDALDEQAENYAQDYRRLIGTMQNLINNSDDKTVRVMFCVSSRPETFFIDAFASWPGIRIHENTNNDVRLYLNGRLNSYLSSRPDLASNSLAVASLQKTFDEVFTRAQGVFLWVKLVATDLIEGLMDGDNPAQIQQHLSSIPGNGDLHELYHRILLSLKDSYLSDALVMLQIAYASLEPLPITEFFAAVNYVNQSKNSELSSQSFDEMERRLLSRCRGFLEVQTASWQDQECEKHTGKIVQFLHQSLKDYLAQQRSFETMQQKLRINYPANGHAHLLRFLTSQHLRRYARKPEDLYQLPQFDLRKYGVLYHSRMVEQTLGILFSGPLDALAKFMNDNELATAYLRIDGWECPEGWNPNFLALATQAGLLLYVEKELKRLGGPSKLKGRPLLHWAVMPLPPGLCTSPTDPFVHSPEMIRLLRSQGANLEEEFEYETYGSRTAFGWAFKQFTIRGAISAVNLTILTTLLSEGADPDVLSDQTLTALQLCIRNSDRLLAKLLLDFHASIEILTDSDWRHLERFNKPMSFIKAFRDGELRARDMPVFAEFYAQDDDQQSPKTLIKQYPSAKLSIRNKEVYVGDWDFVLQHEKSIKRFFRFYGEGEWIRNDMPKPLSECGIETRRAILLNWAVPPDTVDFWY